jgi:hypothetical protein
MKCLEIFVVLELPISYFASLFDLNNWRNLRIEKEGLNGLCGHLAHMNSTEPSCFWRWPKAHGQMAYHACRSPMPGYDRRPYPLHSLSDEAKQSFPRSLCSWCRASAPAPAPLLHITTVAPDDDRCASSR